MQAPQKPDRQPSMPEFDRALPVSTWLWPKLQAYLASQQAQAASRPKAPGWLRLVSALPLLVIVFGLIVVIASGFSDQMKAAYFEALAVSFVPRLLVETGVILGLARADLFGKPMTRRGYAYSLLSFATFLAVVFVHLPAFALPVVLLILYGPLLWKGYKRMRVEILSGRPLPGGRR